VEGQVGNFCQDKDSVYINLLSIELNIEALDPTAICQGDSVRLDAVNNINDANLQWIPQLTVSNDSSAMTTVRPQEDTQYIASVSAEGCIIKDTIRIDVDQFAVPDLRSDTTICQNSSVDLVESPFDTSGLNVIYSWTPTTGLDDPTMATPKARPDVSTTYTLFAASENGGCAASSSVRIEVLPANVAIQQSDTTYLCLDEALTLTALTTTGSPDNIRWTASDGSIMQDHVAQLMVQPQQTTTYYTTFTVGICEVYDSVRVQVDSLPAALGIAPDVEKDVYCQGETIILSSPIYEPAIYPALTNRWLFGLGYETGDSLYNMVVTLQDTFLYQRITMNNACIDTQAILIPVLPPPDLAIIPADTTVCAGESVLLRAQYDGDGTISWSAFPGLSCTDCPNPVVTPPQGTSSIDLNAVEQGCETTVSATFTAIAPPNVLLTINSEPGDTIYVGEPFTLAASADGLSFEEYSWLIDEESILTSENTYEGIAPELPAGETSGMLSITLTAMTSEGCFLETSINLVILQGAVRIPNSFTPNGDGVNDIFRIYYNTPTIIVSQFTVYNRWGKTVFQSSDNQGWDGNYQGEPAPSDVYLYQVVFRLGTFGEEQVMRGDVTLLR
jgi:gliding motility-associated-like protein